MYSHDIHRKASASYSGFGEMAAMVASGKGSMWDTQDAPNKDNDSNNRGSNGNTTNTDATAANGLLVVGESTPPTSLSVPMLPDFSASEGMSGDTKYGGKDAAALPSAAGPTSSYVSSLGNGVPSDTSEGGVGNRTGAAVSSGCVPGVASTCRVCTEPRVSRRITCQGCDESFHWSCMGFYEHIYKIPPRSWLCKSCNALKEVAKAAAKAAEAEAAAKAATRTKDMMDSAGPAGVSVPSEKVSVDGSSPTIPQNTPPPVRAVPASPALLGTPAEMGTSGSGGGGERVCPVCTKGIGRKRTIDCSKCCTPSHASCVNVRGAETPKKWVCRVCQSPPEGQSDDKNGGGEEEAEVAAGSAESRKVGLTLGTTLAAATATAGASPVAESTVSFCLFGCHELYVLTL